MARMSRSPSPSFDITDSSSRPPNTNSTLFQYNADSPYTPERGSYSEQRHEQADTFDNNDDDSVELEHLVADKHVSAHAREVHAELDGERGRKQTLKELLSAYWTFEVVCCSVSLAMLAVIAIILALFNGRAVPDWPFGITLGALVAVIAVIMTFSLTIPIGAGLAQMKWLWYRSERPAADFGIIDEASRNAWGSLKMLVKRKASFIGAFGAILMILTLAIAPFVQQTIQYDTHLVNSTSAIATLPVAFRSHQETNSGDANVNLALQAAFMNGLLDDQAEPTTFNVPVSCNTGVCGWLPYQSLAVSSHCDDLTSDLSNVLLTNETFPEGYYDITLPDGLGLAVAASLQGQPAMTIQHSSASSDADYLVVFEAIAAPLAIDGAAGEDTIGVDPAADAAAEDVTESDNVARANATTVGPYAAKCTLSLVVQSYTGFMTNGIFTESPSTAEPLFPNSSRIDWNANSNTWTRGGDESSPLVPLNDTSPYGMDYAYFQRIQSYLQAQFSSSYQPSNATDTAPEPAIQAAFHALTSTDPHTLDALMANVAASMTRSIRTAPSAQLPVNGTTWANTSMVRVEWAWLALPGALVLLVGMFVALVGLASRRAGLREPWKGSATAVLFHGLDLARDDGESGLRVQRLVTVREMDEAAQAMHVVLRRHDVEDETKGEDGGRGWGLQRVAV